MLQRPVPILTVSDVRAATEVPDVEVAFAQVQQSGVEIVHPLQDEDWGVRRFLFRTRDGHVVNVLSHRE